LLALENIPTTLVASDGKTIEKWLDYEPDSEADLSGSLYVEDNIFNKASQVYLKMNRKRNHSEFYRIFFVPIILQVLTWTANARVTDKAEKLLGSFNISIKYAGAVVYAILTVFETKDFIKKWSSSSDEYRKTEVGKIELRRAKLNLLVKFLMAILLFATAYFLF